MELYRKIGQSIENHLKNGSDKILVIDGARQIGKTHIIRRTAQALYKNYIEVNMEADKLSSRTFAEARTVDDFLLALSTVAGDKMGTRKDTIVFIDEIQAYDHLLTLLKFLREDGRLTYIASGSILGVALKTTSSIPLGSIEIIHMYPLDFEEFMLANGMGTLVMETIRKKYAAMESLPEGVHAKVLDLFKKYLIVGGLPDAVVTFVETKNIVAVRKIHDNVRMLYGVDASRYEETNKRLKIRRIYEMIPSVMENKKKRMVAKDVEDKTGKRMRDYEDEFEYLISSGIAIEVHAISKPAFPLTESCSKNLLKLYMNDVGLLTSIFYGRNIKPIMEENESVNLGSVYETVVAQELAAHGRRLFYYDNKKKGEVDYLIDDMEGMTVLPVEVKSGKDYKIHSALDSFLTTPDYGIHRGIVLSNAREVEEIGGIVYLPIYFVCSNFSVNS